MTNRFLWLNHVATSLSTQSDWAASGDDSRRKYSDAISAASILVHSEGSAERLVSSRNVLSARILFHGLAMVWRTL